MRTISFSKDTYRGEIRTSDLICPAYGNNYLDIAFTQESQSIPSNVTLELEGTNNSFTLPLRFSQLATEQLDGVLFSLAWFRYYAPSHATKPIEVSVYADDVLLTTVGYELTAGRGELIPRKETDRLFLEGDWNPFDEEIVMFCPTQVTRHWDVVELFTLKNSAEFLEGEGEMSFRTTINNFPLSLGFFSKKAIIGNNKVVIETTDKNIKKQIAEFNVSPNDCCDIEIRITDRNGLRGVMGGKIIDSSEGGDDVKSNFEKVTPYNGIYRHEKIGQKIQKEVFFDCEGDADLLGLLRDACVYGVAEWYDERTSQWLPCEVADGSLDTDPFKEQSITFILQQL